MKFESTNPLKNRNRWSHEKQSADSGSRELLTGRHRRRRDGIGIVFRRRFDRARLSVVALVLIGENGEGHGLLDMHLDNIGLGDLRFDGHCVEIGQLQNHRHDRRRNHRLAFLRWNGDNLALDRGR